MDIDSYSRRSSRSGQWPLTARLLEQEHVFKKNLKTGWFFIN